MEIDQRGHCQRNKILHYRTKCLLTKGDIWPGPAMQNGRVKESSDCMPLQWRHNVLDGVSDHQPQGCLLNRLFRRRSKETSKLRVTGLCAGNSSVTAQMASNSASVSIWWRHHGSNKIVNMCVIRFCFEEYIFSTYYQNKIEISVGFF